MILALPIKLPKPANFVLVEIAHKTISIPIQDLSKEQIDEYAKDVYNSILEHWYKLNKSK